MPATLRGALALQEVADFVAALTKSFYGHEGYGSGLTTQIVFWSPDSIVYPNENLPSGLEQAYQAVYERRLLPQLANFADQFAVAVNADYKGKVELKTRVFNRTLLLDILKGQTFAPTVCEFVISTWHWSSKSWWQKFISHRDALVREAQQRVDQAVKGSVYSIISDLC